MTQRSHFIKLVFAILMISTLAGAAVFVLAQRRAIIRQQETDRVQTLERLIPVCRDAVVTKDSNLIVHSLKLVMQDPAISAVSLEDAGGTILVHSNFLKGDLSLLRKKADVADLAWKAAGGHKLIESSAPVFNADKKIAIIRVFHDAAALHQAIISGILQALPMFCWVAAAALAAGLAAAYVLAARVDIRP